MSQSASAGRCMDFAFAIGDVMSIRARGYPGQVTGLMQDNEI